MKKLALLFVFALAPLFSFAQYASEKSADNALKPAFEFEQEVIDYGKIKKGADSYRAFIFKNVGGAPLIIESVKGSCGCTVPTKPEEPVMPGQTGEIKVKYDTKRVGRFTKTVTIKSNATDKPKIVRIKGEVLAE